MSSQICPLHSGMTMCSRGNTSAVGAASDFHCVVCSTRPPDLVAEDATWMGRAQRISAGSETRRHTVLNGGGHSHDLAARARRPRPHRFLYVFLVARFLPNFIGSALGTRA
jgi:hypothetical protein